MWTLGGGHLLRTIELPAATAVAVDACEATLYAGAADGRVFEVPLNASAAIGESRGGRRVDGTGFDGFHGFERDGRALRRRWRDTPARSAWLAPPTANAW